MSGGRPPELHQHAIDRYRERAAENKLDAEAEIRSRLVDGRWIQRPGWVKVTALVRGTDGWFEVAEGVVLPCRNGLAMTCLVKKRNKLQRRPRHGIRAKRSAADTSENPSKGRAEG